MAFGPLPSKHLHLFLCDLSVISGQWWFTDPSRSLIFYYPHTSSLPSTILFLFLAVMTQLLLFKIKRSSTLLLCLFLLQLFYSETFCLSLSLCVATPSLSPPFSLISSHLLQIVARWLIRLLSNANTCILTTVTTNTSFTAQHPRHNAGKSLPTALSGIMCLPASLPFSVSACATE